MAYAAETSVPVSKSQTELRELLMKHEVTNYVVGEQNGSIALGFEYKSRRVRFVIPLPSKESLKRTKQGRERSMGQWSAAIQQRDRQYWRILLFVVKAKLEIVESGIVSFESEFLSNIVIQNNQTVGEWMHSQEGALDCDSMPPMLPTGSTIALGSGATHGREVS